MTTPMTATLELNSTVLDKAVCRYYDDTCKIYIKPHEIYTLTSKSDINHLIQRKVALLVQQSCSKYGFVLSGVSSTRSMTQSNRALCKPLQIVSRSVGEIPPEHLNGAFLYQICYKVFVCNPPIGKVLPVTMLDKNKLGIRCYYYPFQYDKDTNTVSKSDVIKAHANFVILFLPKALHYNHTEEGTDNTLSDVYNAEEERIDKFAMEDSDRQPILHVKILQKRFDINDKQISAVGVLSNQGDAEAYTK